MRMKPSANPTSGLTTRLSTILSRPVDLDRAPARRGPSPAPTRPPTRACDDDDGMPKYQVNRFQAIAPSSADRTTTWVTASGLDQPLADRRGDRRAGQGADEVQHRGQQDGRAQRQHAGAHDRRHGVGRVVEAVDVVEDQRGHDDQDQDQQGRAHGRLRRS